MTAAILLWANARIVSTEEYLTAFRCHADAAPITLGHLSPFHIVMLMPDLVLAVGRSFEDFALKKINSRVDDGVDPAVVVPHHGAYMGSKSVMR